MIRTDALEAVVDAAKDEALAVPFGSLAGERHVKAIIVLRHRLDDLASAEPDPVRAWWCPKCQARWIEKPATYLTCGDDDEETGPSLHMVCEGVPVPLVEGKS